MRCPRSLASKPRETGDVFRQTRSDVVHKYSYTQDPCHRTSSHCATRLGRLINKNKANVEKRLADSDFHKSDQHNT